MITKQCQFPGRDERGEYIHVVRPGYKNDHLNKLAQASPPQLDLVQQFLHEHPRNESKLYTLLSALGAGEFWGSNSNGDWFGLEALLHTPPGWAETPQANQKVIGAKWEWGYPTFYNAHAFAHHVNKDPARSFGEVEYVLWDNAMKRVLLVVAFDRDKARELGSTGILDRVDNGEFPDVSMGCKVPYDVCSRCADWSRITGNPQKDLEEHHKNAIRGLSVVTADYCQHLRFEINKIYPDGVQAKMLNLHPKFFDISVVFIGADKTSKILAKLAQGRCPIQDRAACKSCVGSCGAVPSAHVHEIWSRDPKVKEAKATLVKYAQDHFVDPAEEREVAAYFDKKQHNKQAEIIKQVRSQFSESALPALAEGEPELPLGIQALMSESLPDALSTAGSLGIVATPREFQRMALGAVGSKALADSLDQNGLCFEPGEPPSDSFGLSGQILPDLITALAPMLGGRSALGPELSRRVTIVSIGGTGMRPRTIVSDKGPQRGCPREEMSPTRETEPLLKLLSGQYSSYRKDLIDKTARLVKRAMRERPDVFEPYLMPRLIDAFAAPLAKVGTDVLESLVGMLTTDYLNQIHMPRPISTYVHKHAGLGGISRAGELARFGGVA